MPLLGIELNELANSPKSPGSVLMLVTVDRSFAKGSGNQTKNA